MNSWPPSSPVCISGSTERPGATRWSTQDLTLRAPTAAENEVLAALDEAQRATLYNLLHQAANGETSCSRDDH